MLSACIKMIVQCVQRSLYVGELEKFVTGSLRTLNTELLVSVLSPCIYDFAARLSLIVCFNDFLLYKSILSNPC